MEARLTSTRMFMERSPKGTLVENDLAGNLIGGIVDQDEGQPITYTLEHIQVETSPGVLTDCPKDPAEGEEPAPCHVTVQKGADTDTVTIWNMISVSDCDGAIIVQNTDELTQQNFRHRIVLCVSACDSVEFFGSSEISKQTSLCAKDFHADPSLCQPYEYNGRDVSGFVIKLDDTNDAPSSNPQTLATPSQARQRKYARRNGCHRRIDPAGDADENTLKYYARRGPSVRDMFAIDEYTGKITVRAVESGQALQFESLPGRGAAAYAYEVIIVDNIRQKDTCPLSFCAFKDYSDFGLLSDSCCDRRTFVIDIADANDPPVWGGSMSEMEVEETAPLHTRLFVVLESQEEEAMMRPSAGHPEPYVLSREPWWRGYGLLLPGPQNAIMAEDEDGQLAPSVLSYEIILPSLTPCSSLT